MAQQVESNTGAVFWESLVGRRGCVRRNLPDDAYRLLNETIRKVLGFESGASPIFELENRVVEKKTKYPL